MDPRNPKDTNPEDMNPDEGPELERQDWDAVVAGELSPDSIPENGDFRYGSDGEEEEEESDLLEEDDDNPFQHSDEALPDDDEEAELERDPTHERPRFGA